MTNTGHRTVTPQRAWTSLKPLCSSSRTILHRVISPDPHHEISTDKTSTEAHQEGASARDLLGKTMAAPNIKFPRDTQFTFGSLTFTTGEDGDLNMLPLEAALEHLALVHGPDPCSPANSSTSGGAYLESDPCARLLICTSRSSRESWSWHPSSSHWLEHLVHNHRLHPLITT
jgi:hypothetical protein